MSLVKNVQKYLTSQNLKINKYLEKELSQINPKNLTIEDETRLDMLQKGLMESINELKNKHDVTVVKYTKSDIGHNAIGIVPLKEIEKNPNNYLPIFVINPLFVYAPDINEFIYKRKSGEGIETLINFQEKWEKYTENPNMSEKEKLNLLDRVDSLSDFKEILLPNIQKYMTLSKEEATKLAEHKLSQKYNEDTANKVTQILKKLEDIEQLEDELNLKELQYEQDSVDLELKIDKYNNTVKKFESKFNELEESLNYVTDMENKIRTKYKSIQEFADKLTIYDNNISEGDLQSYQSYFNDHTKVYIDSLVAQFRNTVIDELKVSIEDFKTHMKSTQEKEASLKTDLDYILNSYRESLKDLEDIERKPLELTLDYLEVDMEMLAKDLAMKIQIEVNNSDEEVKKAYQEYLKIIEKIYKTSGDKSKEDIESMKQIVKFADSLKGNSEFSILESNSKHLALLAKRTFKKENYYYVISPVIFANLLEKNHNYAGYLVSDYSSEIGTDDVNFFNRIISFITTYTLDRKEKFKQTKDSIKVISSTDDNWLRRLTNIEYYLKLNAMKHETIKRYGINIAISKDLNKEIQLSNSINYKGGFLAFKGHNGYVIITNNRVVIKYNSNKNISLKYETNKDLQEIFNKAEMPIIQAVVNTDKYTMQDSKKILNHIKSIVTTGLSLISDYKNQYTQFTGEKN